MKKLITFFALVVLPFCSFASDLQKAETLYQDGDFATAKKQYQEIIKTATADTLYQAQLRLAACEYNLGEYLTAAKTMLNYPLPKDTLWQARFLLYRIQMAQQTSWVYNRILEDHPIEDNQDPEYWTRAQWHGQMQKDYEALWNLRKNLINAPIAQETLILNTKDTDTQRIPTLFDFATQQWAEWLGGTEQTLTAQSPRTYLEGAATPVKARKNRAAKLASILQDAYLLEGTQRQNARIFWQTDYILLPFDRSDFFEINDEKKALKTAVDQLNILSGFTAPTTVWQKIKGVVSNTTDQYGKSYAAYRTAQLLWDKEDRAQALAVCQYAVKSLEKSYYTSQCQNLIERITKHEVSFKELPAALQPAKPQVQLTLRNIPQAYIRIYPVTKAELENFYRTNYHRSSINSWDDLVRLRDANVQSLLASTKTYKTAQGAITYEKPYFPTTQTFTLPALEKGFYVALASEDPSFDPAKHTIAGTVINITDIALFVTTGINDNPEKYVRTLDTKDASFTPEIFRIYTVDLKTGQPLPNTSLNIISDWNKSREQRQTDADGKTFLSRAISLSRRHNNSHTIDVWAEKGNSAAFSPNNTSFYFSPNTPVQLFAQTDRAVYRPGQKVSLSVQGFQATPRGRQVLPGKQVEITVRSVQNYKQIFKTSATLNEFGTMQTQFTLPEANEILLGDFSIEVTSKINEETFHVYQSFSVEEYKRPEYEIELNDPLTPLAYHRQGTVKGKATYYTGAALQKATVKYTITQREYIPPFYWWRIWQPTPSKQIAQGETTTNDKGEFSISWKPEPQRKGETATQYTVKAEVYDETGRAIDTSRTYKVSTYPRLFKVDFAQGFYDANKQTPLADVTLTNADGKAISGSVVVRVSRVQDTPDTKDKNSLDQWYQNAKDASVVFTKTIAFNTPGAQTLQLPALPEGIYRLSLKSQQAEDQAMIFVVAAPKTSLKLPDITLPQYKTYHPGETARVLIGNGSLAGSKRVEVYRKDQFLAATDLLPGGTSIYEYVVTEQDRGGLGFSWFGASNYAFHHGNTNLAIPYDNQQLTVTTDVPEVNKPGQTVSWKLTAKNAQNAPINGQASVSVYDKSLDYYAKKGNPFSLDSLFRQYTSVQGATWSRLPTNYLSVFTGKTSREWQEPPQLPTLDLVMPSRYYRNVTLSKGMTMLTASKAAAPQMAMATMNDSMAMEESADAGESYGAISFDAETSRATNAAADLNQKEAQTSADTNTIRTDFAETAYFNSMLPVKNGAAKINFTLPQSVTTWNILGFAITKDAQFGDFTASTITRKDFMVRLHLPRFYREKDNGILQASVMNLTNRKLTVPVTIAIAQDKKNKAPAFGLTTLTKNVTVAPNATEYVQWNITVPTAPGLYQVTASGHSATDSDGEQRTLPVFPSLSRLLASAHVALKNGTNTLTITELNDVSDAQTELAALTVNPSLALSVLNSMPNVLSSPYKDLISSLNRYVPLAIVHSFYTTYPQLKEAVKKLPKRTGLTAPWNETDPLRLTMLEQTPWLQIASGKLQTNANIISLFDDALVTKRLAQEIENVKKFQNASGAFSWFIGGPDDTYLTLRALEAFSQAVQFGAEVPQVQAKKAISYVVPKIEQQLKEDKKGSVGAVSYALYAAYTLSAFPANWSQVAAAKPYIKKWVDYADQQARFMTPLGQIYAAAVYHRLGDDVKANAYLDKVLARMKYNELTGAYFAPEAQSWVWYQDTITTQTATLKTLLEVRPNSDKIDPMVQWLLFNRQVTSWKNPTAAAKAVFALLDVMKTKGALSSTTTYQINWAGTQDKRTFEPFDWTEDLQWVKQGAQLTPAALQAQVTKQGKMTDFASLNVIYTSAEAKASPKGVLNVSREYFVRFTQDGTQKLRRVKEGDNLKVGDEVEVHLTLTTDSAFEYVQLTDPKPAGFESAELQSKWTWNPVSMYQEIRDADTNFFINRLPAGKVELRYVLRPTVPGKFHAKPAQIQSMYAPEYGAHSAAEKVTVIR